LAAATTLPQEIRAPPSPPGCMLLLSAPPLNRPSAPYQPAVPAVTSRAWICPPHLLSPTQCPSGRRWGGRTCPAANPPTPRGTHRPPELPRDSNCSGQRGGICVGEGRFGSEEEGLGQGTKVWVRRGRFGSGEEVLDQRSKIWVREERFGSGTTEPAEKSRDFSQSCSLLWSQRWCWGSGGGPPCVPLSPCPHVPVSLPGLGTSNQPRPPMPTWSTPACRCR